MSEYAAKYTEDKNNTATRQRKNESAQPHIFNRSEDIAQVKMQEAINSSPGVRQMKAYQEMADKSPRVKQLSAHQMMADNYIVQTVQRKENNTGLPDHLKSGIENLSGFSMDDVKVNYNSSQPAQLLAHAYAQGTEIHLAPGQDKHLPHEAWHVVQQKQGRVQPTLQMKGGRNVNDDAGLEKEADVMGAKMSSLPAENSNKISSPAANDLKYKSLDQNSSFQRIVIHGQNDPEKKSQSLLDTNRFGWQARLGRINSIEQLEYIFGELQKIAIPDTSEILAFSLVRQKLTGEVDEEVAADQKRKEEVAAKTAKTRQIEKAQTAFPRHTHTRTGIDVHTGTGYKGLEAVTPAMDSDIVPKDLSARPREMHMSYSGKEIDWIEINSMATVAAIEGLLLIVSVSLKNENKLIEHIKTSKNAAVIEVVPLKAEISEWAEDSGEMLRGGAIGFPHINVGDAQAKKLIKEGRIDRGYTPGGFTPGSKTPHPADENGTKVAEEKKQREKIALAGSSVREKEFVSHIEGGNLLTGVDMTGKAYALVGKDAVSVTKGSLEKERERILSLQEVKEIIAADLGMKPAQVHFVEQPGQFHLDMGMVLLGNGTVLLNDSLKVYAMLAKWAQEDSVLLKQKAQEKHNDLSPEIIEEAFNLLMANLKIDLEDQYTFEQKSLADLTHIAGLNIVRVAGSFPKTDFSPQMNFLNAEVGVSPNGNGFFITNGGDPRAEYEIAEAYFNAIGSTALANIYFLDPETSENSLRSGGGIGCRTKSRE